MVSILYPTSSGSLTNILHKQQSIMHAVVTCLPKAEVKIPLLFTEANS